MASHDLEWLPCSDELVGSRLCDNYTSIFSTADSPGRLARSHGKSEPGGVSLLSTERDHQTCCNGAGIRRSISTDFHGCVHPHRQCNRAANATHHLERRGESPVRILYGDGVGYLKPQDGSLPKSSRSGGKIENIARSILLCMGNEVGSRKSVFLRDNRLYCHGSDDVGVAEEDIITNAM